VAGRGLSAAIGAGGPAIDYSIDKIADDKRLFAKRDQGVCTKNPVRVAEVRESPNLMR
jgi:hypothetical protein